VYKGVHEGTQIPIGKGKASSDQKQLLGAGKGNQGFPKVSKNQLVRRKHKVA